MSLQEALAEVQQLVGLEDASGTATTSTSRNIECLMKMFDLHQLRRAQTYEMILDRAKEVRDEEDRLSSFLAPNVLVYTNIMDVHDCVQLL